MSALTTQNPRKPGVLVSVRFREGVGNHLLRVGPFPMFALSLSDN